MRFEYIKSAIDLYSGEHQLDDSQVDAMLDFRFGTPDWRQAFLLELKVLLREGAGEILPCLDDDVVEFFDIRDSDGLRRFVVEIANKRLTNRELEDIGIISNPNAD